MAWCGMNSHYCIEHVIISIRLTWSLYPPPPGTRAVLQSTVGAGGPWLQSTATPAAPGCGVQPPLLPPPNSLTLVRLTRSKVTNRLLFYYSDIAIFGDVVGGAGVGSVNQTAPGILLQQIAEELPVEVLNLSSTNYTFPMPKILMFFGSICKYLKNLTLLSVVYPSSDSLGQVPSASRDLPHLCSYAYQCW